MFSLLLGNARAAGGVSRGCGDGGTREREQREREVAGEGVEVELDHWAMGAVPTLLSLCRLEERETRVPGTPPPVKIRNGMVGNGVGQESGQMVIGQQFPVNPTSPFSVEQMKQN